MPRYTDNNDAYVQDVHDISIEKLDFLLGDTHQDVTTVEFGDASELSSEMDDVLASELEI